MLIRESPEQIPRLTQTVLHVSWESIIRVPQERNQLRLPGERGYIPPIGGNRTLRSIRKQSAPHMFAIVLSVTVGVDVELFDCGL